MAIAAHHITSHGIGMAMERIGKGRFPLGAQTLQKRPPAYYRRGQRFGGTVDFCMGMRW